MKKRRASALLILIAAGLGYVAYLFCFKTINNEEIWTYNWKGGGCGLSDTLLVTVSHIDGDILYSGKVPLARIVERNYRPYADSYLRVVSEETGGSAPSYPFEIIYLKIFPRSNVQIKSSSLF